MSTIGGLTLYPLFPYLIVPQRKKQKKKNQDVFVKHECPPNVHFLKIVTFIFDLDLADDLDLGTSRCILMRCAFIPNMSLLSKLV